MTDRLNLPTATITLVDGVRIVVPDSLNLITPYVLREQEDWFEDEIKFLRRLLQPGQRVIDIGANYGVYTLCMARAVGPAGRVWAFEPASSTARLLKEGIAANGFAHVTLEQSALSSASGTAQLSLNPNSELNAVVRGNTQTTVSETVPLVTLDQCLDTHGWRDIEFLKIDAEGEESNILKGGRRFFADLSPLVQYEVKAGTDVHLELVRDFAALGYDSYRLVPGLGLLVPFDAVEAPDGYLLNLFCCKPDCAARLAARGFLITAPSGLDEPVNHGIYGWRHALAQFPYAAQFAKFWEHAAVTGNGGEVYEALSLYARSLDISLRAEERYGALKASFNKLRTLCEREPAHLRLASLARAARDFGARVVAVNALTQLVNAIFQHNRIEPGEPFLAPAERFDAIDPGASAANWMLAAALEELERLAAFSSFYTGESAKQRLEIIAQLGFGNAEMQRRLSLLQRRFGPPKS